jgi:FtsP/CotA-like multicopper oxidase with cupredoxin domain
MITMTTKRSGRLGLALITAFVTVAALLMQAPAHALPAGAPKIGMVCTPGTISGSTHHFDLVTGAGDISTPDGNTVFMWSYADANDPDPDLSAFQYPGPNLCVTQGQTVEVHLHNTLPDASSIVFPGQDAAVTASGGTAGLFTREAATGGDVTYSFTAGSPGTYLYESGTDVTKQVEMGLYGALIVRPTAGPSFAYNAAATQFDPGREYLLLLAEIDPALHHAVETGRPYDWTTRHNRYYTVNGRSFPDTIQDNGSDLLPSQPYGALVRIQPTAPGDQPALIRMLDAGMDNHPFHPHGNHTTQIAQDGSLVAPTEHFGETIGSGQTEDFLIRWDNKGTDTSGQPFNDDWNPVNNPLPVAQPNYRNLTFKDGNTWYAGSPYLGYKGTLPTGTISQNVCGEWYFPWHSHALNEFTNFDEGFGGMATLLRVDPPAGCFASSTSTKILQGTLNAGTFAGLAVDDLSYYKVNSTTTGNPRVSDWYGQFSNVQPGSTNLKVTYKGNDTFPYAQNFNTLVSTGTGNSGTLPAGWAFTETGGNTTYAANNGSSGTGNTYSYGANGSMDRAFGGLRTGSFSTIVGAAFTNNTGSTITSLSVGYTGEQWRYGGGGSFGVDRLNFSYSTNATNLTNGTWNPVSGLDFTSRVTTGAVRSLDGNASANRLAVNGTITGLSIAPGATYRIRWTDFDRGGSAVADDGLAVDDLSIVPGGPTVSTTVSVWNWTTSSWTQIAGPTPVGVADVTVANNTLVPASPPGSWANYIGTGANQGSVRVRVLSTGVSGATASFVTGGNLMRLVYTAP